MHLMHWLGVLTVELMGFFDLFGENKTEHEAPSAAVQLQRPHTDLKCTETETVQADRFEAPKVLGDGRSASPCSGSLHLGQSLRFVVLFLDRRRAREKVGRAWLGADHLSQLINARHTTDPHR